MGSLKFKYSELAAALLLCSFEPAYLVLQITGGWFQFYFTQNIFYLGYQRSHLNDAKDYILPFLRKFEQLEPVVSIPYFADVPLEDRHNIQSYIEDVLEHLVGIGNIQIAI